jgi:hypothetical protein
MASSRGCWTAEILEIRARTGRDPGEHWPGALFSELGDSVYHRLDKNATTEQKARLGQLSIGDLGLTDLGGDP